MTTLFFFSVAAASSHVSVDLRGRRLISLSSPATEVRDRAPSLCLSFPPGFFFFFNLDPSTRFDGTTLRILESILVARDVESLLVSRAALRGLLLSEASSVIGGASGMTVEKKLRIVQFFVGAFALVGDGEVSLPL